MILKLKINMFTLVMVTWNLESGGKREKNTLKELLLMQQKLAAMGFCHGNRVIYYQN